MIKDYILKHGLILGSINIILLVGSYALGVQFFLNDTWLILKTFFALHFLIYFVIEYKK